MDVGSGSVDLAQLGGLAGLSPTIGPAQMQHKIGGLGSLVPSLQALPNKGTVPSQNENFGRRTSFWTGRTCTSKKWKVHLLPAWCHRAFQVQCLPPLPYAVPSICIRTRQRRHGKSRWDRNSSTHRGCLPRQASIQWLTHTGGLVLVGRQAGGELGRMRTVCPSLPSSTLPSHTHRPRGLGFHGCCAPSTYHDRGKRRDSRTLQER